MKIEAGEPYEEELNKYASMSYVSYLNKQQRIIEKQLRGEDPNEEDDDDDKESEEDSVKSEKNNKKNKEKE